MRYPRFRRARARWIVEQKLRGATHAEVAEALGVTKLTVVREVKKAVKDGIVEEVRDKLLDALALTPLVYQTLLEADVAELTKNARGYKLKLDAANALNDGQGTFRKESTKNTTISLQAIAAESGHDPDEYWGSKGRKRVAFQPDHVDGELIED